MPVDYILRKKYINWLGLDLKSTDLTREEGHASGMKNAQYRSTGAIEKRRGYQCVGDTEDSVGDPLSGFGLFAYDRVHPNAISGLAPTYLNSPVDIVAGQADPLLVSAGKKCYVKRDAKLNITYTGTDPKFVTIFFSVPKESQVGIGSSRPSPTVLRIVAPGHEVEVGDQVIFTSGRLDGKRTLESGPGVLAVNLDGSGEPLSFDVTFDDFGALPAEGDYFEFNDNLVGNYLFQVIDDTDAVEQEFNLGVGIDEAPPVTIAGLSTLIGGLADFTTTTEGFDGGPAAFLNIARNINIFTAENQTVTFTACYWELIPSEDAEPFAGSETNKSEDFFENISGTQINNVLYLTNGYDTPKKYDGQYLYRAGIPQPDINEFEQSAIIKTVDGEVGHDPRKHYAYHLQYVQRDAAGNLIEGNITQEPAVIQPIRSDGNSKEIEAIASDTAEAGSTSINIVASGHVVEVTDRIKFIDGAITNEESFVTSINTSVKGADTADAEFTNLTVVANSDDPLNEIIAEASIRTYIKENDRITFTGTPMPAGTTRIVESVGGTGSQTVIRLKNSLPRPPAPTITGQIAETGSGGAGTSTFIDSDHQVNFTGHLITITDSLLFDGGFLVSTTNMSTNPTALLGIEVGDDCLLLDGPFAGEQRTITIVGVSDFTVAPAFPGSGSTQQFQIKSKSIGETRAVTSIPSSSSFVTAAFSRANLTDHVYKIGDDLFEVTRNEFIRAPGHIAVVGDQIRFTNGEKSNYAGRVLEVIDANNFRVSPVFTNLTSGVGIQRAHETGATFSIDGADSFDVSPAFTVAPTVGSTFEVTSRTKIKDDDFAKPGDYIIMQTGDAAGETRQIIPGGVSFLVDTVDATGTIITSIAPGDLSLTTNVDDIITIADDPINTQGVYASRRVTAVNPGVSITIESSFGFDITGFLITVTAGTFTVDEPFSVAPAIGDQFLIADQNVSIQLNIPFIGDGFNTRFLEFADIGGDTALTDTQTVLDTSGWYAGDIVYFYDKNSLDFIEAKIIEVINSTTIKLDRQVIVSTAANEKSRFKSNIASNGSSVIVWRTIGGDDANEPLGFPFYRLVELPLYPDAAGKIIIEENVSDGTIEFPDPDAITANPSLIPPIADRSPPPKAKYVTEFQSLMVLAGDVEPFIPLGADDEPTVLPNAVSISDVLSPEFFPIGNSLDIESSSGDEITGIAGNNNNLCVFKDRSIHSISGNFTDLNVRVNPIILDIGCVAHATIQEVRGVLYFMSARGPYYMQGGQVPLPISDDKIEPVFVQTVPVADEDKFRLKRAVAVNNSLDQQYILFVPKETVGDIPGPDTIVYANENSEIYVHDYDRNAWLQWSNMNMAGGAALLGENLFFQERTLKGDTTDRRNHLFQQLRINDAYDYQDNIIAIDFQYDDAWEFLGEPSVLKRFLDLRIFTLEEIPNSEFRLNVTTENEFIRDTTKADYTFRLLAPSYGDMVYGRNDYGSVTEGADKRKLNPGRFRSIRIRFANNKPQENTLISGWEMQIAGRYKGLFKK